MSEKFKNELRKEKEKLSRMSFGQKLQYIFDYYKFYIIGAVVAVVLVSSVVSTFLNNKPLAFYAMMLNASGPEVTVSDEKLERRFAAYEEISAESEKVVIDTTATFNPNVNSQFSMAQNAKITALFASHDLDAMIVDPGVFTYYALNGAFADLRDVLGEIQLNQYESENRIYYIDRALQEKLKNPDADPESVTTKEKSSAAGEEKTGADTGEEQSGTESLEEGKAESEDPSQGNASSGETLGEMEQFAADLMGNADVVAREDFRLPDPEKMEDPIPVGIIVTDAPIISTGGFFSRTVAVYGIPTVSDRKQLSLDFLRFLELGTIE